MNRQDSGKRRLSPRPARRETFEAATMLLLARALVAMVRFGRWRHWLGEPQSGAAVAGEALAEAHRLARVVERGALRLPLAMKCLPRAMALHWMLTRRGIASALVIAIRPGQSRGAIDDLHAWVEQHGEIVIGAAEGTYVPLVRYARNNRSV